MAKARKCTENEYQLLVQNYQNNPKNIKVCRALMTEYIFRGYNDAARDMLAWINEIEAKKKNSFLYKFNNIGKSIWNVICKYKVITILIALTIILARIIPENALSNSHSTKMNMTPGILIFLSVFLFFIPAIIAYYRKIQYKISVGILNVLTFISSCVYYSINNIDQSKFTVFQEIELILMSIPSIFFGFSTFIISLCIACGATRGGDKNL